MCNGVRGYNNRGVSQRACLLYPHGREGTTLPSKERGAPVQTRHTVSQARTVNARETALDETALAFLEVAFNNAEPREIEGQLLPVFIASVPANALGLSMAERPEGDAYRRTISQLVDSGAIMLADIRGQGQLVGEEIYAITPQGEAILREAGLIA